MNPRPIVPENTPSPERLPEWLMPQELISDETLISFLTRAQDVTYCSECEEEGKEPASAKAKRESSNKPRDFEELWQAVTRHLGHGKWASFTKNRPLGPRNTAGEIMQSNDVVQIRCALSMELWTDLTKRLAGQRDWDCIKCFGHGTTRSNDRGDSTCTCGEQFDPTNSSGRCTGLLRTKSPAEATRWACTICRGTRFVVFLRGIFILAFVALNSMDEKVCNDCGHEPKEEGDRIYYL